MANKIHGRFFLIKALALAAVAALALAAAAAAAYLRTPTGLTAPAPSVQLQELVFAECARAEYYGPNFPPLRRNSRGDAPVLRDRAVSPLWSCWIMGASW